MKECPHCNQLSLEEFQDRVECYKCSYVSYHSHPIRPASKADYIVEEEKNKIKQLVKENNWKGRVPDPSGLKKRELWNRWAARNKDYLAKYQKARRARLKQEAEGKNNTASILIE